MHACLIYGFDSSVLSKILTIVTFGMYVHNKEILFLKAVKPTFLFKEYNRNKLTLN